MWHLGLGHWCNTRLPHPTLSQSRSPPLLEHELPQSLCSSGPSFPSTASPSPDTQHLYSWMLRSMGVMPDSGLGDHPWHLSWYLQDYPDNERIEASGCRYPCSSLVDLRLLGDTKIWFSRAKCCTTILVKHHYTEYLFEHVLRVSYTIKAHPSHGAYLLGMEVFHLGQPELDTCPWSWRYNNSSLKLRIISLNANDFTQPECGKALRSYPAQRGWWLIRPRR